jgi:hypothetical protein
VFSVTGVIIGWRRLRLCASGRGHEENVRHP